MPVEPGCQRGRYRLGLAVAAACGLWLALGCLRAGKSRAERDQAVGSRAAHGWSVSVDDGHAVVLSLAPTAVALWGSAPAFGFSITSAPGATELAIELENHVPGAELVADSASVRELGAPERISRTHSRWQVRLSGTHVRFWVGPPDHASKESFEFGLLSDVQEAIDGLHDIIERMNQESEVRFVIGAGDLTVSGTRDELERFKHELLALEVPYYTTLGNHELGQDPPPYHETFGRGNYSFEFHQVRFTMLDSASATLDPLVYDWLETWLEQGRDQTHVVSMHIPPLDPSGTRHGSFASKNEAAKLLNRLAMGAVDLTLYGHIHTYLRFTNAGIDAHIAGGGGAIPNRGDGIGRHYMVVRAHPKTGIEATRVVEVDSDWAY